MLYQDLKEIHNGSAGVTDNLWEPISHLLWDYKSFQIVFEGATIPYEVIKYLWCIYHSRCYEAGLQSISNCLVEKKGKGFHWLP